MIICSKFIRITAALLYISSIYMCAASVDNNLISIKNIEVKCEGDNPIAAKQNALSEALYKAFEALLSSEFNIDEIDEDITKDAINECLYEYSINNEKYSESFYLASLSYKFNRNKIISLLKQYNIECAIPENSVLPENKSTMKIVISNGDFINNYVRLQKMNYFIESFSGTVVVLSIQGHHDLEKLGIEYANI